MHLTTGSRLGPYEITGAIGAGGMGEVYRARDSRLGREVAIKVLPAHVSQDPDRLVRFEREARAASALNHRNIVTIHDFNSENGQAWLVMELIRGSSLRELLAGGGVPLKRLLPIAAGVANGLAAAHAAGLVHRDLKPENIMIAEGDTPKILDFGLVKQVSRSDPDASTQVHVSRAGMVVGTAGYMSPEQARGDEVDFRTDQFSLGVILYEAAKGIHPFRRATAVDTLAAILNDDPKPLDPDLPESLVWIIERCLAKNPQDRYGSTADLAHDLARFERGSTTATTAARPARTPMRPWLLLPIAVAAGLATGVLAPWKRTGTETALPVQAAIPTPDIADVLLDEVGQPLALSPDGRHLAIYGADGTGATGLWVRSLATGTTRKLAERAFSAGWSSDGNHIAYFADGKLMTIGVDGGPPRTVCAARPESTPSWHKDTILFAQYSSSPGIYAVNAAGGQPRLVVPPAKQPSLPWWPQFLPDGRRFLFLRFMPGTDPTGGTITHSLEIATLDGTETQLIANIDSRAVYANGHLLFVRDGTLLAQPFDPDRGRLSGEPRPVVEGMHYFSNTGAAAFTVSENGMLAWRVARRPVRLAWLDRRGVEQETIVTALMHPDGRLSPDGRRYAVGVVDPKLGTADVWIYDLQRQSGERLTYRPLDEHQPVWTPDGGALFYRSDGGGGPPDIFRWTLGEKNGIIFHRGRAVEEPQDVSADGRSLLFTQARQVEGADVHILPLVPNARPNEVIATPFKESSPRFSPDGRWIAYASDASGTPEVYVRPVTMPATAVRVSQQGGKQPRWGKGGRELYFLASPGKLMSVPIGADGTPGTPEMLFAASSAVDFDAAADGSRFIVQLAEQSSEPVVHLLTNWPARLQTRSASR